MTTSPRSKDKLIVRARESIESLFWLKAWISPAGDVIRGDHGEVAERISSKKKDKAYLWMYHKGYVRMLYDGETVYVDPGVKDRPKKIAKVQKDAALEFALERGAEMCVDSDMFFQRL